MDDERLIPKPMMLDELLEATKNEPIGNCVICGKETRTQFKAMAFGIDWTFVCEPDGSNDCKKKWKSTFGM